MTLTSQTEDGTTRYYRMDGLDYRVMFSARTGNVFAVHKRASDGEFRKCPRQADYEIRRLLKRANA